MKGRFAYSLSRTKREVGESGAAQAGGAIGTVGEDHQAAGRAEPRSAPDEGIYFFYRPADGQSNSLAGTVEDGFAPVQDREWLIQVCLDLKGGDETSAGKPAAR